MWPNTQSFAGRAAGDLGMDDTKKLKRYLVSLQSTTLRERGDLSPPACFEWED